MAPEHEVEGDGFLSAVLGGQPPRPADASEPIVEEAMLQRDQHEPQQPLEGAALFAAAATTPTVPRAVAATKLVVRETADLHSAKTGEVLAGTVLVVLERLEMPRTRTVRARVALESFPRGVSVVPMGWVTAFKDGEAKLEAPPTTPRSSESMAQRIARRRQERRQEAIAKRQQQQQQQQQQQLHVEGVEADGRSAAAEGGLEGGGGGGGKGGRKGGVLLTADAPWRGPPALGGGAGGVVGLAGLGAWAGGGGAGERKQQQSLEADPGRDLRDASLADAFAASYAPGGPQSLSRTQRWAPSTLSSRLTQRTYYIGERPPSPHARRVPSSRRPLSPQAQRVVEAMRVGAAPSSLASPTSPQLQRRPHERLADDEERLRVRLASLGARLGPGPGAYEPRRSTPTSVALAGSASFKSGSDRTQMRLNPTGDPGAYLQPAAHLQIARTASAAASASAAKSTREGRSHFGSRSERNVTYDPAGANVLRVLGHDGAGGETPPPDAYTPKDRQIALVKNGKELSASFRASERKAFKLDSHANPGPGAYDAKHRLTTPAPLHERMAKTGRDAWMGGSDVDNWSLPLRSIHAKPHLGPGTYEAHHGTLSKEFGALKAHKRWSASLMSENLHRPTGPVLWS